MTSFMPYYRVIEEVALSKKKDVYVFDPAHDINFSLVRELLTGGEALAMGLVPGIIAEELVKRRTRRGFLGVSAALGAGIVSTELAGTVIRKAAKEIVSKPQELKSGQPNTLFPQERNFRWVVVAKGLQDLADTIQEGIEPFVLPVFYPPTHWAGIRYYLQHPEHGAEYFNRYEVLKNTPEPMVESLFTRRRYASTNQGWELQEQVAI
jgi:hypothetical protein